ncbi:hypothetical protein [Labilibacter marinus]|uniref:hypothetical protein n=1 Tax=Labilibacter marinus TaxID=1477105 RepID=UPI000832702A|nr:hypothetical protein [Labilibacter marinus]
MENPIVIIIIAAVAFIIFGSIYFSKKAIIKRKLKKATYKRISHFRDGDTAKIVGKVELVDKALIAPLSNRECAHYHITVEQKKSSGKNSHWSTIIDESQTCNYVIREGEHYAFINSSHMKSYIVKDRDYSSGTFNDATEELEKYLNSKGHESENFLGLNKSIRYKEGILESNEEIAVLGQGHWKTGAQLGLPSKYKKILEIVANNDNKIFLSDATDTTSKASL